MGRREDPAQARCALARACRGVARDAAGVTGSPLVELLLGCDAPGPARWRCVALAAPDITVRERQRAGRALARSPALATLPQARARRVPRVAAAPASVARILGGRTFHEVFLPLDAGPTVHGWLRLVRPGRPDRAALRAWRALVRGVEHRLEAEALRQELAARHRRAARDAAREKRALADLSAAKDTLAALNLAGTHLMVESDPATILGVIGRELSRLGLQSAVLVAAEAPEGPRPPFRYAVTSFSPALQRAAERVLGRALADVRVDPRTAPLVARVLREGRTTFSARAPEAARQLFGAAPAQVPRLMRLLRLRHVVVAPLRYAEGISGLLAVAAPRLRKGDPGAIDAFATQASIALEKARLFAELRSQQARLESEVERRTRELRQAVRALEEQHRRKDNFLANVSHELRTPLVTVLGYTDLVLSEKLGELGPRQRECLRIAAASGRRLRSFIDELLEFSRFELTRERLRFAPFDLRELLSQAVVALAPRFGERGVGLRARAARGLPPVQGDRDRVLQVLVNLLANAERYCGDGGHVRVAAARGERGKADISVTDDGQGISAEHLERIFDRLYQVGDVVKQREKGAGLGLGLAIAKGIVEAHGGSITVRSRVGRGTSFRFSLPLAAAAPLRAAAPEAAPVAPDAAPASPP
jgi:signal transduction histidine kinase